MPRGKKFCQKCGASNGPRSKICSECSEPFPIKSSVPSEPNSDESKPRRGRPKKQPAAEQLDSYKIPQNREAVLWLTDLRQLEECPYEIPHPLMDEEIREWTKKMFHHRINSPSSGGAIYRFGDMALKHYVLKKYDITVAQHFLKVMWDMLATLHLSQYGKYTKEKKHNLILSMQVSN